MTTQLPPSLATSWQLAHRAALTVAAWAGLAAAAVGQSSTGSSDEELLLSYRRADANSAATASSGDAPSASNASGNADPANPLRPADEPPQRYQFANAQPADSAAATPPTTNVESAAPLAYQLAQLPSSSAPTSAAPAAPLLSYEGGVEQAVHNEASTPTAEDKSAEKQPEPPTEAPLADIKDEAEPQASPLPGVPLPPASASLAEPAKPLTTAPASDESRLLAPRSKPAQSSSNADASFSDGLKSRLPSSFSKMDSLTTAGAGLAIVVGLFFVCMWLLRRTSGSKPGGLLPNEAFAVLGRAPLTPQSFAQLLRVGNKLVLVAVSADGIQPLTEVIDPLEVDRLTGVCASGRGHGPAAEFQQVLAQLAREPARGFLGAEAASGGGRRRA